MPSILWFSVVKRSGGGGLEQLKHGVALRESRVLKTLFLHLVIGAPSSLFPNEENVRFWLTLNVGTAILFAVINFILWKIHKNDSMRYFSLHSLVMMMGMAFYGMSPAFKGLYPSLFFWILLVATVTFILYMFWKSDSIARALIDPQQTGFKTVIMLYAIVMLIVGGALWSFMLAADTAPMMVLAIILYMISLFFIMISPAMLVKTERAREFRLGKD